MWGNAVAQPSWEKSDENRLLEDSGLSVSIGRCMCGVEVGVMKRKNKKSDLLALSAILRVVE